ncbi:hypothetical protein cand_003220 [Cryptosporidium andersoni]|uniref:Uncharacterized protein n=1 Tax=Cryptosporidium andersoni TaxID=117008 RepID=A0A1J4MGY4_9CRYT|nr:hypothetical protein cand_003220 [Cryptosporidium andersoni]
MKSNLISNYLIFLLFYIFLLKIKNVKSSTDSSSINDTISDLDINLLSMEDIFLLCNNFGYLLDNEKSKIYNLLISYKNYYHFVEDESRINECIQKLQSEISVESEINFKSDPMKLLRIPVKMPKLFVFEVQPISQLPIQPLKYVAKSIQVSNIREEDITIPLKDIDMRESEDYEENNTITDTLSDIKTELSISNNSEDDQSGNNYGEIDSEGSYILDNSDNSTLSLPSLPSLPSIPSIPSIPYNTDHSSALDSLRSSSIYSPTLTTDISD